jgi:hypothetical protein
MRMPRVLATACAWLIVASLAGCEKELCLGADVPRCEGDVRHFCRAGWLQYGFTVEQENCAAQGKRCVGPFSGSQWVGCESAVGRCDPAAFTPRCVQIFPNESTGRMTQCSKGDELVAGNRCDVPKELILPTLPP